jgi:hypothetical protein
MDASSARPAGSAGVTLNDVAAPAELTGANGEMAWFWT